MEYQYELFNLKSYHNMVIIATVIFDKFTNYGNFTLTQENIKKVVTEV